MSKDATNDIDPDSKDPFSNAFKDRTHAPPAPAPSSSSSTGRQRSSSLPPTFSDKLMERVTKALPDWLAELFVNRQRSVLLAERRIQRKFMTEYRAQVRALDPLLRERGRLVGESVLQAFVGHHAARIDYKDIEKQSKETIFFEQKSIQEILRALDPLIQPV